MAVLCLVKRYLNIQLKKSVIRSTFLSVKF